MKPVSYYVNGAINRLRSEFTPETPMSQQRLQICAPCPNRVNDNGTERCGLCGCPLKKLVLLEDVHCKAGKW